MSKSERRGAPFPRIGGAELLPLLVVAGLASPTFAQDTPLSSQSPGGWQFNVVAFAWLPSITGNMAIRGHEFDDNASFSEIVRKSDLLLAARA